MTQQSPSSTQSRWRAELGRRIGLAYAQSPKVAAVLIAGSTSRGDADHRVIAELAIAPPDVAERLRLVLTADVPAAAEALGGLVEEVYDLVEEQLPEVDVGRLRSIFRWQRQAWDAPPQGALGATSAGARRGGSSTHRRDS